MSRPIHGKSTAALKFLREEPAALAVYWCYVARSNIDNVAWPSADGLARDTGWDKATCLKGRGLLVQLKALERVEKYIRPQWRSLTGKPLSQRLNLDKSEYYRPTGVLSIKGATYNLLYISGNDENDIDHFIDGTPRPPSIPSDVRPDTPELDLSTSELDLSKNSPPSGDPASTPSKPKVKTPSRLYRDPSEPSEEVTPEAARIALLPSVSFDDFLSASDSTDDISITDGLFNAVSDLFSVTDVEKRPNSEAGMMVGMLRGNTKLKGEWGQNAMPKNMIVTGADLRAWASWWREQPENKDLSLPKKPLTLPSALQTWILKGKPLSWADRSKAKSAPTMENKPVVEEKPLTEAEREERLRQLKELRERRGK